MKIETKTVGTYTMVTVYDELKVIADLTEFKQEIEKRLALGERNIAVNFFDASYLYSGAISVLITCFRMIREKGGNLCIVEPQERVLDLLVQMNIDSLIDIYKSEKELAEKCSAVPQKKQH